MGVLSILILGLFIQKETRFRLGWILEALRQTGSTMLIITPIAALAGIVVGTLAYTGGGFLVSLYLSQVAGGNLFILLPVIAIACFILGVVQLGIEPIAAHLFILYYATASMVTPPVCIAAYAGAAIAGSEPMRTGFAAARFGIIAYIVPFLFVFFPALIFKGSPEAIFICIATALLGCFVLSAALSGHLFKELNPIKRVILGLAGIGLLIPIQRHLTTFSSLINVVCGGLALLLIIWEWRGRRWK
jgi:TRAP-type uncharacterized transport system fused permease subunit